MRQLVNEKEKRNVLLEEKLSLLESKATDLGGKFTHKSFADIVSGQSKLRNKIPPIIIIPKDNVKPADIVCDIKNCVDVSKMKIPINSIKTGVDGKIRLKCNDEKESVIIKTELDKILTDKCEIDVQKLKKPRLKIVGVENDYTIDETRQALINQNSIKCSDDDFKVLHIHQLKNKDTKTIYIETVASIFHKFLANNFIYIGWQRCRLYEDLNLNRCFNCNTYGHNAKKCNNQTSCAHCAGSHSTNSCPDKTIKQCINCVHSNTKYKLSYSLDHHAYDENLCQSYAFYKNVAIARTAY